MAATSIRWGSIPWETVRLGRVRPHGRVFLAALLLAGFAGSPLPAAEFVRGDVDGSGALEVTDSVRILRYLFSGAPEGVTCADAADADDSGTVDISDALAILNWLFGGTAPPPAPYPLCGPDPTADALGCETFQGCPPVVEFYGVRAAADAAFFVLDRSQSVADGHGLGEAKAEVARAVAGLHADGEFGIVIFDRGVLRFPSDGVPAAATEEGKEAAAEFLEPVGTGIGTCTQQGLMAALEKAEKTVLRRKAIFYWGDGGGTCQGADELTYLRQTVASVTARNRGMARIFTIGYGVQGDWRDAILRELAESNGGEYRRVEP